MHIFEARCRHDMLILNGRSTCSLCLGLDDRVAIKAAGFSTADFGRPNTARRQHPDDVDDLDDDDLDDYAAA